MTVAASITHYGGDGAVEVPDGLPWPDALPGDDVPVSTATRLTVRVLGIPQPAGSKRAFVNPRTGKAIVTDANAKSLPWKQQVAWMAHAALPVGFDLIRAPVVLDVTFVRPRPRSHYGTGRNADRVKASAPMFPTTKPDTTKLLRGVEDALTGVVWADDAQVIHQTARKQYGTPEGAVIRITAITTGGTTE